MRKIGVRYEKIKNKTIKKLDYSKIKYHIMRIDFLKL